MPPFTSAFPPDFLPFLPPPFSVFLVHILTSLCAGVYPLAYPLAGPRLLTAGYMWNMNTGAAAVGAGVLQGEEGCSSPDHHAGGGGGAVHGLGGAAHDAAAAGVHGAGAGGALHVPGGAGCDGHGHAGVGVAQ